MLYHALLLGATLLLCGCLSPGEARLPGGTYFIQPSEMAGPMDAWTEIVVSDSTGSKKYLIHVLNTDQKTRLTLIDCASLATLLTCSYEQGQLTRTGLITAQRIPTELPLSLLQIVHWPKESVKAGLRGGLDLVVNNDERRLVRSEDTVAVVSYLRQEVQSIVFPSLDMTISLSPVTPR